MFFPTEPPKAFAQSQNIPYNFMSSSSHESFLFFRLRTIIAVICLPVQEDKKSSLILE